jgi:hypothetical protein
MQNVESTHSASNTGHYFGTQQEYAGMFEMIFGAHTSQVVHTAALYSLSEHLAEERNTPTEIAAVESLHVDATFRLMRACAAIGLMTYDGHGKFAATPLLDLNMLVLFDGRERTLDEFKALFTAAGFLFASATPTSTPFVLIEAVAA